MTQVNLVDIEKKYESPETPLTAVREMDMTIYDSEMFALVGPSGCGKTTTLRLIAGLESPSSGSIVFDNRDVTKIRARERNIAMVFQDPALYPHFTVRKNIDFPLRMSSSLSNSEIRKKVINTAKMLGIESFLKKYPNELSGGQQQRVALGRAIVRDPDIFLLDEPLSSLDAQLRSSMRKEIVELYRELSVTTIYVTHNQRDAMAIGDRIGVMKDGRIHQVGTPNEVYSSPQNEFVARFLGNPDMNFIDVEVSCGKNSVDLIYDNLDILEIPKSDVPEKLTAHNRLTVGVRPENIRISQNNGINATVSFIESQGRENVIRFSTEIGDLTVVTTSDMDISRGDTVNVGFETTQLHFFNPDTGEAITS